MTAPLKIPTLPEVPTEVWSFAAANGVSEWVNPVLELTARVFARCPIKVFVENDSENSDWQYIVLEVGVSGYDGARLVAARTQWSAEIVRSVPAYPRQYFIYGLA
jgi:hypothetical protein